MLSEERGLIATNQTLQSFWIEKLWTISDEFYYEKTHKRDRNKQLRYDYRSNIIQEEQMLKLVQQWPVGPRQVGSTLITLVPPWSPWSHLFTTWVPPRYQLDILSAGKRLLQCLLIEYCTFYEKCQPTIGPTTLSSHFISNSVYLPRRDGVHTMKTRKLLPLMISLSLIISLSFSLSVYLPQRDGVQIMKARKLLPLMISFNFRSKICGEGSTGKGGRYFPIQQVF